MKTLNTIFATLLITGLSLSSFAADTTDTKKDNNKHKCKVANTVGTSIKTLVQVYDQAGNLTYETAVDYHTPAIEERLPEGSLYLFTHDHVAYYMLDKSNKTTALNAKK